MDTKGEGRAAAPVIAGYDVVRLLGSGAQGSVWLVAAQNGGALLAAKCFWPAAIESGDSGGRDGVLGRRHNESEITQEWRVLAQCDHDHLIKAHEVVSVGSGPDGGAALLMDYAAGGSVRDIVAASGPIGVGEAVTILTPLGQVLSFLHGRGVVHGDVAPGNILLTAHGKPMLGDLGFARLVGQGRQQGGGTPGFQCPADEDLTQASDVFSLAAVGWFALTGQPPPPTRDRMPLSMYVPGVPAELTAALEAGLDESASHRPTAAAFAQAVFRSARAEPVALAQSVHPSVLPELLTRRAVHPHRRGRARPLPRGLSWARMRRSDYAGGRGHFGRAHGRKTMVIAGLLAAAVLVAGFGGWRLRGGNAAVAPVTAGTGSGQPIASTSTPSTLTPQASPEPSSTVNAVTSLGRVAVMVPAGVRAEMLSHDPVAALTALAWVRTYALSSANFTLLEAVNAAGSPASQADAALARALKESGHSYAGLTTHVVDAAVAATRLAAEGGEDPSATAAVRATVTTSPFAEQDAQGAVVHQQEKELRQELDIVLMLVNARWVIQEILPLSG
ncbi:serine/threonine-protein kinase [Arthrobacter sp. GMC3]|uniref:serine/threonine protein kinase n=1 Tax=Arthrobacter sp. GMC3 TaxID=2058894 RepID=UPI000CE536FB|nr:serine/threonine-protein kinase [Arthrobacter sp. GMC3]